MSKNVTLRLTCWYSSYSYDFLIIFSYFRVFLLFNIKNKSSRDTCVYQYSVGVCLMYLPEFSISLFSYLFTPFFVRFFMHMPCYLLMLFCSKKMYWLLHLTVIYQVKGEITGLIVLDKVPFFVFKVFYFRKK